MTSSFLARWSAANAMGLAVGFVAVLQTGYLLQFGLNFEVHWSPAAIGQGVWLGYRFVGLLIGGAIFALAQTLALGSALPRKGPWVVAGATGYGAIAAVIWPFWAAGLWGRIPGPVEPLLITIGGGSLMGCLQWWHLRSKAAHAARWLRWWLIGLFVSLPATFLFFFVVMGLLKLQLPWPAQVGLSGLLVGGVAGLFSARATQNLAVHSPVPDQEADVRV